MAINALGQGFQANYTVVRKSAEAISLQPWQRHYGAMFSV